MSDVRGRQWPSVVVVLWLRSRAPLTVLTGAAVFCLALVAVELRPAGSLVSAWWPAGGVAVAATAVARRHDRPIVVLGVGIGAFLANLVGERPLLTSVGFGLANMVTPLVCVAILTRGRQHMKLHTVEDFGRFLAAAFTSTAAAGLVAGITVQLTIGGGLLSTWGVVFTTHSAAVLIIVPLTMSLPPDLIGVRPLEAVTQAVGLFAVIAYVGSTTLPLMLLPLPFLVWGAMRLPGRLVCIELFLAGAVISMQTTVGNGPFAAVVDLGGPPELVGVLLEAALLVYALVTLPLMVTVHRQRAALASARESSELLDSVLQGATGTGIIGTDATGIITVFNSGAERLLGYRAEEVLGRATPALFHDPAELAARAVELGVEPGFAVFTSVLEQGAAWEQRDWSYLGKSGSRCTVSLRTTARRSADGSLLGYLTVAEDVTDARAGEQQLRDTLQREREAVERLEQLDEAKTQFVSSVSHELRTPLTSLLGYTDLVVADPDLTASQRTMLEAARRNGRRLLRLIEDLLTVSRIESGTFGLKTRRFDLREAVSSALDAVEPLVAVRALELGVHLGEDPVCVTGDPDQLERVAINLITNAIKFTPEGGSINVRAGTDRGIEGMQAFFEVGDDGVGIPADEQGRLFERFWRSSTSHRLEVPGTGLGLSIVDTIVTAHGGRTTVVSAEDQGSTVTVWLPALTSDGSGDSLGHGSGATHVQRVLT